MENKPNSRKFIFIGFGAILLIVVITWVWHYLHTGTITITTDGTNNSNVITISKLNTNSNDSGYIKQGSKQLSANVPLGTYIVKVSGKVLAVSQTVSLTRHEELRYYLNAPQASISEPVVTASASGIVANSAQLLYLDSSVNRIKKVNAQDNLSLLKDQDIQNVKWASASFGVGEDSGGHFYTIKSGSVTPLNIPFSPSLYGENSGDATTNFDVSPTKQIYISHGADVYASDQNGNFKKIYASSPSRRILAASADKVAVSDGPSGSGGHQRSSLAIITSDGTVTKRNINSDVLSWSPDGHYLALAGYGRNNQLVDASLKQVAALPVDNGASIGALAWLDNNTLVYSIGNNLWSYKLNLGQASVMASLQPGTTITHIALGEDSQYFYVASQTPNGGLISRIGLHGQTAPEAAYIISVIFPQSLSPGDCTVNSVNFTQITLNVVYSSSVNNCQSLLQTTLRQYGIDSSQLKINYSQIQAVD